MNIKTIKFIDKYKGFWICKFLGIIKHFLKEKEIKKPKKILLLQFWGIGESLLTLPAIKALRERFKNAQIDILVTGRNIDVYYKRKELNNVIKLDLDPFSMMSFMINQRREYDLVVDFEEYLNISSIISFFVGKNRIGFKGGVRGDLYTKKVGYNDKQHTVKTFLDLVGLVCTKAKVEKLIPVNCSQEDEKAVKKFLKNKGINKDLIVGVAPGAAESARSRMWPGNRFAQLADSLIEKHKARVVFIGNKKEKKLIDNIQKMMKNRAINAAGSFTVRQLFAFIKKCDVVISNDTGPMHIAAAQCVKTIGLFGPNTPVRWAPYGKGNKAIYKPVFCSPCIHTHKGIVPECKWPKGHKHYVHCMKNISVEEVERAFESLISH